MRKTLIATAICLAIGFALPAMADDTQTGSSGASAQRKSIAVQYSDSSTYTDSSMHSWADSSSHTNSTSGSFNTTNAVANSELNGTVSGVTTYGNGNVAQNWGNANGGKGGSGGDG